MKGALHEGKVPALLREIYVGRKSGLLTFRRGQEQRGIRFRKGHLVGADTNVSKDRLGEVLVRQGLLSVPEREQALELAEQEGKRLGAVLVEAGLLTREALEDALALHVHEILARVFTWRDGTYAFNAEADAAGAPEDMRLKVSTGELILEAARSVEDPDVVRYCLGDIDRVLGLPSDPLLRFQHVTLTPTDGYVLSRVDGTLSAREVVAMIPLPPEGVHRSLFALLSTGMIHYLELPPRPRLAADPGVARRSSLPPQPVPPQPPQPVPGQRPAAAPAPPVGTAPAVADSLNQVFAEADAEDSPVQTPDVVAASPKATALARDEEPLPASPSAQEIDGGEPDIVVEQDELAPPPPDAAEPAVAAAEVVPASEPAAVPAVEVPPQARAAPLAPTVVMRAVESAPEETPPLAKTIVLPALKIPSEESAAAPVSPTVRLPALEASTADEPPLAKTIVLPALKLPSGESEAPPVSPTVRLAAVKAPPEDEPPAIARTVVLPAVKLPSEAAPPPVSPTVVLPAVKLPGEGSPAGSRRAEILEAYAGLARQDHFEVLGLGSDASDAQLKTAYFRLARRFHPDVQHDPELADLRNQIEALFDRVGEAYAVLGNPQSRASYLKQIGPSAPNDATRRPSADAAETRRQAPPKSMDPDRRDHAAPQPQAKPKPESKPEPKLEPEARPEARLKPEAKPKPKKEEPKPFGLFKKLFSRD